MSRWVVIGEWDGPSTGLFAGRHQTTPRVVEAETEDEAARLVISGCSVLELRYGVALQVLPVLADGSRYRAKYANPGSNAGREHSRDGMPSDLRIEKDITKAVTGRTGDSE